MTGKPEYPEDDAVVTAYQGRIRCDGAEDRAKAAWLVSLTQRRFGVAIAEDSFTLSPEQFTQVAPFLAMNRHGLVLEFRPVTADARPADAAYTICTYDDGDDVPAELQEIPNTIVSWHFHIYYDLADIEKARWLRAKIIKKFKVATYQVEERAGGPHPKPNLEIQVGWADSELLPWLALNRQGLSVHVHPRSEDFIRDHVEWPLWLGTPVRLIEEERLDGMRPPGKELALRHFNGAPHEPPSPDTRFPPTA